MKKLFLFLIALSASAPLFSQIYLDGIPLDSLHEGHYLLIEQSSEITGKCYVMVEADHDPKTQQLFPVWLTNAEGKRRGFKTRTQALNYFYEEGWEVVFVFPSPDDDGRFLLRRRVN